jgi:hypothetical protein
MPKLIEYPRTSYTGAWELAEIVDDTGGKCAIETAARKLNRKVSGSFKAIIGSAVKFGLMTSKRDLLTNTTLFRRIKHAYDKAEELQFHREAFLTPPLFTQLCRKFRNRELPVQMLDVMLIREFGVEEINAQSVAKAFVDGCRMCGLLDEMNIIADIDAISTSRVPRRELANQNPTLQAFAPTAEKISLVSENASELNQNEPLETTKSTIGLFGQSTELHAQTSSNESSRQQARKDAVASLFGLEEQDEVQVSTYNESEKPATKAPGVVAVHPQPALSLPHVAISPQTSGSIIDVSAIYQMQMNGPGVNTILDIIDEDDLSIAIALLEKIRRQLRANK